MQDAYSVRCIPQVYGATLDGLRFAAGLLATEMQSATDNPLLFPDSGDIISGGNFHGQPIALALDTAAVALSYLGTMAERRIERLVNPQLSGLPPFLTTESGLSSGLMLAQYTAASLVSENKVLTHPASVDSIPTSANQEDVVSMGPIGARKGWTVLENVRRVVAIEWLAAAQAAHLLGPERLSPAGKDLYDRLRARVAPYADGILSEDLAAADEILAAELASDLREERPCPSF